MARQSDPRTAYIAVATRVFAQDGYHGASLATLAKASGVSKQALLHFFGTKAQLYTEVLSALADRQMAELHATRHPAPGTHLIAYFAALQNRMATSPEDAYLVVRALLDSVETARTWPLKPYLDALADLVLRTDRGATLTRAEAHAWAFQMIGAIQYMAIAQPTSVGMFGADMARSTQDQFGATVFATVQRMAAPLD